MTTEEWPIGIDPPVIFALLRGCESNRKRRLFGAACCRLLWDDLTDPRSRAAIEATEAYADGLISKERLSAAQVGADRAIPKRDTHTGRVPGTWQSLCGATAAKCVARPSDIPPRLQESIFAAVCEILRATHGKSSGQAVGLLRCAFGNPSPPVAFAAAWRTDAVLGVAARIYEAGEFGNLPVLADALQDAGCELPEVLDHCRGAGPHARGCWVLDLVLGKS